MGCFYWYRNYSATKINAIKRIINKALVFSKHRRLAYLCLVNQPIFIVISLGGEVAGVVFPLGDEGGHVGREVAVEVHLLSCLGVDEAQRLGVQGLARAQLKAVVDELGVAG